MKKLSLLKTMLLTVVLLFGSVSVMVQAQIVHWQFRDNVPRENFGPNPFVPTQLNSNLTTSGLTRHWTTSGNAGVDHGWGGNNFTTSSFADALVANEFFTFTLNVNADYILYLSSIGAYNIRRSGTGPTTGQWQYAVGAGDFTNLGSAITWGTNTAAAGNTQTAIELFEIAELQGITFGTTITFRLVVWGATGTGGTFYFNDANSTVTANQLGLSVFGTVVEEGYKPAVVELPYHDDFAGTLGQFQAINIAGAQQWETMENQGSQSLVANINGGTAVVNEDWLVSPMLPFETGLIVNFYNRFQFVGPALRLKYSTNYLGFGDPRVADWTDITDQATWSTGITGWRPWTSSGDITVNPTGNVSHIHFAFVYTSLGTGTGAGAQWQVADFSAVAQQTVEVPNIAAFLAANTIGEANSTVFKITGDVTFVFRSGRNVYIRDDTAGLLLFDNTTPIITNEYNNGDVISGGVFGTFTTFNGMRQMVPTRDLAAGTSGTPVEPTVITMEHLLANFETYTSQLIRLTGVTTNAQTANGGTTFGTGAQGNMRIFQDESDMQVHNEFGALTGQSLNAAYTYDITGFVFPFNANGRIAPRDMTDIVGTSPATPTISVVEASVPNMITRVGRPTTQTITVNGFNLIDDIVLTIEGADAGLFSVSPEEIIPESGGVSAVTVTITYTPTAEGTHAATLTLSNTDAQDVILNLNGTALPVVLAAWNFRGAPESAATFAATEFDANLVSADGANNITRGSGASGSAGANSFRTTGFGNAGIDVTGNRYFEVTLRALPGYQISLTTIDAQLMGTGTFVTNNSNAGAANQFAYSLDGVNFTLIGNPQLVTTAPSITNPAVLNQIDLTGISALQDVTSTTTITIRFYASGQTPGGGWGFFSVNEITDGLVIDGTTTAVPTIIVAEEEREFTLSAQAGDTGTETITVSGIHLTANIELEITGEHYELFSVCIDYIEHQLGKVDGTIITITYAPENGSRALALNGDSPQHTAILTLSSAGAEPVTFTLNGVDPGVSNNIPEVTPDTFAPFAVDGQVHFMASAGEMVEIFNVTGQLVHQGIAHEGLNIIAVRPGIALLRVGGTVNKLVVR